ncbi:hypothetical protein EDB92DRAFT_1308399 [Lactarius akahatsu]|uniref:Uncharacterized protein n=1 Tax=Lactarius akahatsu TaxID=416441 RepID=A0AAD4LLW8_9AGAM|nr:hypothetical protein EDB92DRAFT_1308399 [Lactarius akahatsu]
MLPAAGDQSIRGEGMSSMGKLVDVFKSSVGARSLDRYKGYCSCSGGCNDLRFVNLITTMTSRLKDSNKDWCGMEARCENNYGTHRSAHFCTMTGGSEVLPLPTPFHQLSSLLEAQPDSFISGNKEIQDAALRATEHVFNIAVALAASYTSIQLSSLLSFPQSCYDFTVLVVSYLAPP